MGDRTNPKGVLKYFFLVILLSIVFSNSSCSKRSSIGKDSPWSEKEQVYGASVSFDPMEQDKAEILKGSSGIKDITMNIDKNKVNKVSQRRDPDLKDVYPEIFGPDKEFKPLFMIIAKGPGIISISSPTIKNITIKIKNQGGRFLIYPKYNIDKLFKDENEEEEVEITFTDIENKTRLVDKSTILWSKTREIFLNDQEINDIASIIKTQEQPNNRFSNDPKKWLYEEQALMDSRRIKYEHSMVTPNSWQKIRTTKEILLSHKATSLDAAVLMASDAMNSGLKPYIVTTDGHIFVGISRKKENISQAIYIDSSIFLTENNISVDISESIRSAKATIIKEMEKDKEKVLALDIKEVENIYRRKP
jgi:hypothetical protein